MLPLWKNLVPIKIDGIWKLQDHQQGIILSSLFRKKRTSNSTRSSDASAMMPSGDQSIASTHAGQHLSTVTFDMTAYKT